jgi:Bacterial regulatory helix-turn-helix protein, lysR family
MVMTLAQLRYFLAACEERSFTSAARRCAVSQPSLTNAIRALEQDLGGLLFHRRPHVALTRLGLVLRPHFESIVRAVDETPRIAAAFTATAQRETPSKPLASVNPMMLRKREWSKRVSVQRRRLATLAMLTFGILVSDVVARAGSSQDDQAYGLAHRLGSTCAHWNEVASLSIVRQAQGAQDADLRRVADALFRMRRAQRSCELGLVWLACQDYQLIIDDQANLIGTPFKESFTCALPVARETDFAVHPVRSTVQPP